GRSLSSIGRGRTDDHGEFRITEVPPGRYYVTVGTQVGMSPPLSGATPQQGQGKVTEWQQAKYAFQVYPGVLDIHQAVPVDVSESVEAHIEMKALPARPGYRIRGSIIDSATGMPPVTGVQMKIISR